MKAFDATIEILKVRLANSEGVPNNGEAKSTSEYAEKLYYKLKELKEIDDGHRQQKVNY